MVISLGPFRDRPRRHLRGGSRLSASASNLITAGSEIAAGRIALFTPARVATGGHLSLLLSLTETVNANLDCQRVSTFPRLSPGTRALRSSDFPLAQRRATILSHSKARQLSKCKPAMLAGGTEVESDWNHHPYCAEGEI